MEDPLKLPTDDDVNNKDPLQPSASTHRKQDSGQSKGVDSTTTELNNSNRTETVVAEPLTRSPQPGETSSTSASTSSVTTPSTSEKTNKALDLHQSNKNGASNQTSLSSGSNDELAQNQSCDEVGRQQQSQASIQNKSTSEQTSGVVNRRRSTKDDNLSCSTAATSSVATSNAENVLNNNNNNNTKQQQQQSPHDENETVKENINKIERDDVTKNEILSTDNGAKRNDVNIVGTDNNNGGGRTDDAVDRENNTCKDGEKSDLSSSSFSLPAATSTSSSSSSLKTNEVKSESNSIHMIVPGTNGSVSTVEPVATSGETRQADSSSSPSTGTTTTIATAQSSTSTTTPKTEETKNEAEKDDDGDEVSVTFLDRVIKHALKNRLSIGNFDTNKPFDINRRPGGLPAFNSKSSTTSASSSSSTSNSGLPSSLDVHKSTSNESCDNGAITNATVAQETNQNTNVPFTSSTTTTNAGSQVTGSDRVSSSSSNTSVAPASQQQQISTSHQENSGITVTSSNNDRPSSNSSVSDEVIDAVGNKRRRTISGSSSNDQQRQEMIDSKYRTKEDLKHARMEATLDLSKPVTEPTTQPSSSTLDLSAPTPRSPIDLPPKKATSLYMSAPDFTKSPALKTSLSPNPFHVRPPDFEKSAMTSKQLQIPPPNFAAKLKGGNDSFLPQPQQMTQERLAELTKKHNYIGDLRIKPQEVVNIPSSAASSSSMPSTTPQPIYLEEPPLHVIHKGQYQNLKESKIESKSEPVIVKSETTIKPLGSGNVVSPPADLSQSQSQPANKPPPTRSMPYKPRHKEYAPDVHLAHYKGQLNVLAVPEKIPPDKAAGVEQIHRTPTAAHENTSTSKIITVPNRILDRAGVSGEAHAQPSFPYKMEEPKFGNTSVDAKAQRESAERDEEFSFKLKERQLRQEGTIITVKPDPAKSSAHLSNHSKKPSYSGADTRPRDAPYDPKYDPHYMSKPDQKPAPKELPRDPLDLYAQIKDSWIRDSYQGRATSPARSGYERDSLTRAPPPGNMPMPYSVVPKAQMSARDPSPQQRPPSPKNQRTMYLHISSPQEGPIPRDLDPRYYNPSPEQLRASPSMRQRVMHEHYRPDLNNKPPHGVYDPTKGAPQPPPQQQTYIKHPGGHPSGPMIHPPSPAPGRPFEMIPQHSVGTPPSHSRSPIPPVSSAGRAMMNPPTNWPQPPNHPHSRSLPSPHSHNVSPHNMQTPPSPVPMFVHPSPRHSPSPSPTGRPPVGQSPTHYRNATMSPSMPPHQGYPAGPMHQKAHYFPPDDRYMDSKGKMKKVDQMYPKDRDTREPPRDPRDSPRYNIIPSPTQNYPPMPLPPRPGSYDMPDKRPMDYPDGPPRTPQSIRPDDKYQHRYGSQPELTVKYSSNENLSSLPGKGDPMHPQQGRYDSYMVKYPSYEANLNYGPAPPKMNQPDFRRSDADISRVSMETSRSRPMETIARVEISKHLPEPGPYDRQRHENQKMHPQANESYKIQLDISAAIKHETNRHGMDSHRPSYTTYHHSIPSTSGNSETVLRISEPVPQPRPYPEQLHSTPPGQPRSISPKRYDVTISKVKTDYMSQQQQAPPPPVPREPVKPPTDNVPVPIALNKPHLANVKRESPLDLSVKTVKTKADSTGCDDALRRRDDRSLPRMDFTPNFFKHEQPGPVLQRIPPNAPIAGPSGDQTAKYNKSVEPPPGIPSYYGEAQIQYVKPPQGGSVPPPSHVRIQPSAPGSDLRIPPDADRPPIDHLRALESQHIRHPPSAEHPNQPPPNVRPEIIKMHPGVAPGERYDYRPPDRPMVPGSGPPYDQYPRQLPDPKLYPGPMKPNNISGPKMDKPVSSRGKHQMNPDLERQEDRRYVESILYNKRPPTGPSQLPYRAEPGYSYDKQSQLPPTVTMSPVSPRKRGAAEPEHVPHHKQIKYEVPPPQPADFSRAYPDMRQDKPPPISHSSGAPIVPHRSDLEVRTFDRDGRPILLVNQPGGIDQRVAHLPYPMGDPKDRSPYGIPPRSNEPQRIPSNRDTFRSVEIPKPGHLAPSTPFNYQQSDRPYFPHPKEDIGRAETQKREGGPIWHPAPAENSPQMLNLADNRGVYYPKPRSNSPQVHAQGENLKYDPRPVIMHLPPVPKESAGSPNEPLNMLRAEQKFNPINVSTGSIGKGADKEVINRLKSNLEQKGIEKQRQIMKKQNSSEMSEEDSKSDISSLLAARIRTKAELKGYHPVPPLDPSATKPPERSIELPKEPIAPPNDIEGTSAFDVMDWENACDDFVEQLQTGKKRGRRKRPDKDSPVPGGNQNDIYFDNTKGGDSNISQIPPDVMKTIRHSSSDEDKPLQLLRQQSAPEGKNDDASKSPTRQVSDTTGQKSSPSSSKTLARREKSRLGLEMKIAARIGKGSSSESETEEQQKQRKPKKRVRKPRTRSSLGMKEESAIESTDDEDRAEKRFKSPEGDSKSINSISSKPAAPKVLTPDINLSSSGEETPKSLCNDTEAKQHASKNSNANSSAPSSSTKKRSDSINESNEGGAGTGQDANKTLKTKAAKKDVKPIGKTTRRSQSQIVEEEKEETMTRSRKKLQISNSKILRNDKIVHNVPFEKKPKNLQEVASKQQQKLGGSNSKSHGNNNSGSTVNKKDDSVKVTLRTEKRKIIDSDSEDGKNGKSQRKTRKSSKLETSSDSEKSEPEPERQTINERLRSRKSRDESTNNNNEKSKNEETPKGGKKTTPKKGQKDGVVTKATIKVQPFPPGWQNQVYAYKKSLKVPTSLISVMPNNHNYSTSLPDLEAPSTSDASESFSETSKASSFARLPKAEESRDDDDGERKSIIDLLHQRMRPVKPKSNKGSFVKQANIPNKKTSNSTDGDLLPTPVKENNKEEPSTNKKKSIFDLSILKTRTRNEQKNIKSQELIREVFGAEDRPGSAPPLGQELSTSETFDEKYAQMVQRMNEVAENSVKLKKTTIKKEPSFLQDDDTRDTVLNVTEKEIDEQREAGDNDREFETPSVASERDLATPVSFKSSSKKKGRPRRKMSSGFDYVRKRKKPPTNPDGTPVPSKRRIAAVNYLQEKDENDISKEIRSWVLNKGVGESAMHKAARLGYLDVIAYCLFRSNMDPDTKNNAGYTALHEACAKGHLKIARLLLECGANHSAAAIAGFLPLHEAVQNNFVELTRLLISYGADPCLSTYKGETPEALAETKDMQDFLKRYICDLNDPVKATHWLQTEPWKGYDSDSDGYDVLDGLSELFADEKPKQRSVEPRRKTTRKQMETIPKNCDSNLNSIDLFKSSMPPSETITAKNFKYKPCAVVLNNIGDIKDFGSREFRKSLDQIDAVVKAEPQMTETESENEVFEFEESEWPLPPLYILRDEGSDKWVMLNDLCTLMKVKSKEAILKQIDPNTPMSQLCKDFVKELKLNDFIEKANCLQLLCAGEKLNARSSKVVLVRYNDAVKQLLNVKTIVLKM